MTFQQAQAMAEQMKAAGEIIRYSTGHSRERGRFIEVETEQGWCPCPMWQEIEPDYNPLQDY